MSQYLNFYIKFHNVYTPIGSYCRNSIIYEFFNGRYEILENLTEDYLSNIRNRLCEREREYEEIIIKRNEEAKFLLEAKNSIEAKLDAYHSLVDEIEMIKVEQGEIDYALNFCTFLETIMEEHYSDDSIDKDNYIFYGVEVPNPNISPKQEEDNC